MLNLGLIGFATPWALAGLLALPLLWLLLRVIPPAPRRIRFPALILLLGLKPREETPRATPWWLILLRLGIAALVILALAGPVINPGAVLPGSGPLILVIDDGWAAARDWPARQAAIADAIDQAERGGRALVVATTAPPATGEAMQPTGQLKPAEARTLARAVEPKPWAVDRAAARRAIDRIAVQGAAHAVWFSDGLATREDRAFAERLQQFGGLTVMTEPAPRLARVVLPPQGEGGEWVVPVLRADGAGAARGFVRVLAGDGRLLAREAFAFAEGARKTELRMVLPAELLNEAVRLELDGERTAGSVVLLDERWRRRPVGIVSSSTLDTVQPLLTDTYYVERALQPFSEVRRGPVAELMKRELAVLVLADAATPDGEERATILKWVEAGGLLLRFAGANLAENADELVPVPLRRGGRTLGGTMLWTQPARLAPFEQASPFAGLAIPKDVAVSQQVLAEPALDLAERTWAHLADGTPIVTAARKGGGYVVLIHTTANTVWSNLPLSGLFVEMLRRIVRTSQGVAGVVAEGVLPPFQVLDGFARLGEPPPTAGPIQGRAFADTKPGPKNPPGFYGRDLSRRALNLSPSLGEPRKLAALPSGVIEGTYAGARETDLKPYLLALALLLFALDAGVGLALRGFLPLPRYREAAAAAIVALAVLSGAGAALAQQSPPRGPRGGADGFALEATLETRLAYVVTGKSAVDATSRAGLIGLTRVLNRRTAVEAAEPMGVELEQDELAFFFLLYWPIEADQRPLTPRAARKLTEYLRNGGTVLIDTRDQNDAPINFEGMTAAALKLRQIGRGLAIPPLAPVPPDHVLTKAFYLLQDFPGRWAGGQLWVEQPDARVNDGVSSMIVGGNDWAAAWAVDEGGQPAFAVIPGGENQREMAFRFGVNLVMYALTGNYKADQVHVPAILERLGQ